MEAFQALSAKLSQIPGLEVRAHEPMAHHTTFRVGGPAALMALPKRLEELSAVLRAAAEAGIVPFFLGKGSNLLVADEGVDRFLIKLAGGLTRLERDGETGLYLGSGLSLSQAANFAAGCGLTGLEFAHGIPGTVGGGVYMNAGAYGGEIRAVCRWSQEMLPDGTLVRREGVSQGFGYRTSVFQHTDGVIVRACFALQPGDPGIIRETMRELMTRRTASQPLDLPSAGSAFKRPQGGYAAALIESAGLKGLTVGGAQVSEKHAGFVVNRGGATAADVLELLRQVQQRVLEHSGIRLEPEIRLWD